MLECAPLKLFVLLVATAGNRGRERRTKKPEPETASPVSEVRAHIAGVVNVAPETAIRWKLLKVNPMAGVQLPKVPKTSGAKALDTGSCFGADLLNINGESVVTLTGIECATESKPTIQLVLTRCIQVDLKMANRLKSL